MFTSRKDNTNDASSTQKEYIYTKTGCLFVYYPWLL